MAERKGNYRIDMQFANGSKHTVLLYNTSGTKLYRVLLQAKQNGKHIIFGPGETRKNSYKTPPGLLHFKVTAIE